MEASRSLNIPGGTTDGLEAIHLRASNLALTRFDERMPFRSPGGGQESRNNFNHSTTKSFHSRVALAKPSIDRRNNFDNNDGLAVTLSKRLSMVIPGSQTEIAPEPQNKPKPSVLKQLMTQRRRKVVVLIATFAMISIIGFILTVIYAASLTSQVGLIISIIMFIIGTFGAAISTFVFNKPDLETKERIRRREDIFSMFKKIEFEENEKETSTFLSERIIPRAPSGGSDHNILIIK
uniref:Uncharacterized protein n=2 Tax=Ciona intestinalis TaxID=7719 RepID=H2XMU6_CIOIN